MSNVPHVRSFPELLQLAEEVGPYICVLKTHIDIIVDFDDDLIVQLTEIATRYNFQLFEDRKFADIGNTVVHQYRDGIYKIASWSHFTNAHPIPGPGIVDGLRQVGKPLGRGLLLLAQMSSQGALTSPEYAAQAVQMAKANKDFVFGFISQDCLVPEDPSLIYMTPGVQLNAGTDALGQQYNTPDLVIRERKCDIIIVGRGVYKAPDCAAAAKEYMAAGWEAYKKRISQ
ncbi:orotidine 5'-phosphate decarboxylase [Sphaeroforma arctica JP610]|uniref:Orotidine 5'-phosphate decarboxylase n=1 Tax=Sphaeroforma arctica JP610 TaxID=667725 RepID=A0A0L0FEU2_9EUKA|nr:orotidine 5'-phosphate decarboxylase [Sphaeroforma arctica JP610]KNC75294.1 orotidine 5'-phosphate decarboxylase [Sphaeroforma arctica JP610]|eukprot:XP_014149196.1 orotidine 5'-phosphate decarboxylase [Sphaeroforma arctica JP610]